MTTSISQIPTTPFARRAWIKYQLELRGQTLGKIASAHGVTRATVQKALRTGYPKMERLIAKTIELAPQHLWPERYDARGERLAKRGRPCKTSLPAAAVL